MRAPGCTRAPGRGTVLGGGEEGRPCSPPYCSPPAIHGATMKVGLVGFAGSGKTTVFNTMTGLDVPVGFGGEVRLGVSSCARRSARRAVARLLAQEDDVRRDRLLRRARRARSREDGALSPRAPEDPGPAGALPGAEGFPEPRARRSPRSGGRSGGVPRGVRALGSRSRGATPRPCPEGADRCARGGGVRDDEGGAGGGAPSALAFRGGAEARLPEGLRPDLRAPAARGPE